MGCLLAAAYLQFPHARCCFNAGDGHLNDKALCGCTVHQGDRLQAVALCGSRREQAPAKHQHDPLAGWLQVVSLFQQKI